MDNTTQSKLNRKLKICATALMDIEEFINNCGRESEHSWIRLSNDEILAMIDKALKDAEI